LLELLAYLQTLGIPHGFLVPESIFMLDNVIKLAPHSLINGPYTLLSRYEKGEKSPFIAPEDVSNYTSDKLFKEIHLKVIFSVLE